MVDNKVKIVDEKEFYHNEKDYIQGRANEIIS
jgi:hypothetical protein